jgi:F-type H+-transporting ATPase subunit c
MDLASAKMIGAGLAGIGVGAAAIGVGIVFGQFLNSAIRNPAAAELLGLMAFVVAMMIMFM